MYQCFLFFNLLLPLFAHTYTGSDASVVAFPDTVVNVSCWCNSSKSSGLLLVEDVVRATDMKDNALPYLMDRNMTFVVYETDDVWGYNVSVVATTSSNGTFFKCFTNVCDGQDCITSPDVYIYAAHGRPISAGSKVALRKGSFSLCRTSSSTKGTKCVGTEFSHIENLLDCSVVPPC